MKLSIKLYFWLSILLCCSISTIGSLLISTTFSKSYEREKKQAVNQYEFVKFVVQSRMIAKERSHTLDEDMIVNVFENRIGIEEMYISLFDEEKGLLETTFPEKFEVALSNKIKPDQLICEVKLFLNQYYLIISGQIMNESTNNYLMCGFDITSIFEARDQSISTFFMVYTVVCVIASIIIFGLAFFILRPIGKLTKSAQRIASGNYEERAVVRSKDEIGELAYSFNQMAEEIERKIIELEEAVVQRDNFVANFAHELKTPLTSVIGYSDMIYQKELTRKETKDAAEYIMNEGIRLEALSLKLMDLFMLNKQEFLLEYFDATELFDNIVTSIGYLLEKRQVSVQLNLEESYIKVEYDLFKTMILNMVDNAIKAKSTEVKICGYKKGAKYRIEVVDNGCGIPKEELKRVLEAFYVVDKSRSREQHGVGLGLALCEKIAEIHGTTLEIDSEVMTGTTISFYLITEEEKD